MAGAGYLVFTAGQVLTAAQVNTYLNQQTVMVFASAAARDTALATVKAQGMFAYLKDVDQATVYNGSAWVKVLAGGPLGRVGCTVSGTSGGVTLTSGTFYIGNFLTKNVDTDGFFTSGNTVTIPAGFGGLYAITYQMSLTATTAAALAMRIAAGGKNYTLAGAGGVGEGVVSITIPLLGSDTIATSILQNSGGNMTLSGHQLTVYRLGL